MSSVPTNSVKKVVFSILNDEQIKINSTISITTTELFDKDQMPNPNGLYSTKLGTTDHRLPCKTCELPYEKDHGHFGLIQLNYPLFSPLLYDFNKKFLSIVCFECSHLVIDKDKASLINPKERLNYARKQAISKSDDGGIKVLRKECPNCGAMHPIVRKHPLSEYMFTYIEVNKEGKEISKPKNLMTHMIKEIFDGISDEDVEFLGLPIETHPKNFILTVLNVPPVTLRPNTNNLMSVKRSNDNNLTAKLQQIVRINNSLAGMVYDDKKSEQFKLIDDMTNYYFEFLLKSRRKKIKNENEKSASDRLKGKKELIRNNIFAKRVRKTGRNVIVNNPTLKINQALISLKFAKILHAEETVQEHNIQRLNVYFRNGTHTYPGCTFVKKKNSGHSFKSDAPNLFLEIGDVIYRNVIDGDFALINRAPSLLPSALTAMELKVSKDPDELTLGINVSACDWFGADFDGDQMQIFFNSKIHSRYEISQLSSAENWFISYANSVPAVGQTYDSIIGLFYLTLNSTKLIKKDAMRLFARCTEQPTFTKESYTGRELVSMTLTKTPINMTATPTYYDPNFAKFINYDPEDIEVIIRNGVLIKGVLDKKTISGGSANGLYHIIAIEYGPSEALRVMYDMQQIAIEYNNIRGVTLGIMDLIIPKEAQDNINVLASEIIKKSELFTEKLNDGGVIAPLDQTVMNFYEQQQIQILQPLDSFDEPILKSFDINSNNLMQIILSGSKGKIEQLRNMIAVNGQKMINGERTAFNFGYGRTSPYHTRGNAAPIHRGYITNSYMNGLNLPEMITAGINARYSFIIIALMTSKTGDQNRKSVKNLEGLFVNNYGWVVKGSYILQFAYGEDMTDPRKIHEVKFGSVKMSNKQLESVYKHKSFPDEYKKIIYNRELYRSIYLRPEHTNYSYTISDKRKLAFDAEKVIINVMNNQFVIDDQLNHKRNPTEVEIAQMVVMVNEFIDELPYCLINETQRALKAHIPEHLRGIVWLSEMNIRECMHPNNFIKYGIIPETLDVMLKIIKTKYSLGSMAPGMAIGIIAAQSFSEPLTQYMLDAKHSAGTTKKTTMIMIKELLGAKTHQLLKYKSMYIPVKEEYMYNKVKVQEIANNIEGLIFKQFVNTYQIFFEKYGEPINPEFKHEIELIKNFNELNPGLKVPVTLVNWCIRFTFDKMNMITKNTDIDQFVESLRHFIPALYIVYSSMADEEVVMRCYIKSSYFKNGPNMVEMEKLKNVILDMIVKGVSGITQTSVVPLIRSRINEAGEIEKIKDAYIIQTSGSNMVDVALNPDVVPDDLSTSAVTEVAKMLGIAAARNLLIQQLHSSVPKCDYKHLTIYADEMTFTGTVTSIERNGLKKRGTSNVFTQVGFDSPIQTITTAMINKSENVIDGITSKLFMGATPNCGTYYNTYAFNEDVIQKNYKSVDEYIEEL